MKGPQESLSNIERRRLNGDSEISVTEVVDYNCESIL
jgi:hypothetical protein